MGGLAVWVLQLSINKGRAPLCCCYYALVLTLEPYLHLYLVT